MGIKELTIEEFNLFTNAFSNSSVYQTSEYALSMNHQEYNSLLLGLVDERGNVYGATMLLIEKKNGFKYANAPHGFLIDYQNAELVQIFTKEIKRYLSKKDVIAVKISPMIERMRYQTFEKTKRNNTRYEETFELLKKNGYFHMGYNSFFEAITPRFQSVLSLKTPVQELFQKLDPEIQKEVIEGEQMGIQIYKGNEEQLEYLYLTVKDEFSRDLNFLKQFYQYFSSRDLIEFYYAKLDTEVYLRETQKHYQQYEARSTELNQLLMKPGEQKEQIINEKMIVDKEFEKYKSQLVHATSLLREFPNGIILSSLLLLKHKKTVTVYLDGYDKSTEDVASRHLLFWKVIERYANLNYDVFNLGGVANPTLPEHPYQELNRFKTSFKGEVIEYIGDLELITNTPLYFMYRNTAPLSNIFNK